MRKKLTYEDFVRRANEKHNGKYDYSKTDLENRDEKGRVLIICPTHGEFWQRPSEHLNGSGCKQCSYESQRKNFLDVLENMRKIHGDKYEYDSSTYVTTHTPMTIICPIHGPFTLTPNNHINGHGCKKCATEKNSKKRIVPFYILREKFNKSHNFKYTYDETTYIDTNHEMRMICPKHGEFWQMPSSHLQGKGCKKCRYSHLEKDISIFLHEIGFTFDEQKKFEWLGKQSLDFYIPSKNIAIECQGKQHFIADCWGKTKEEKYEKLKKILELDERKRKLCEEHGVKLLYYSNLGIDYPYHVFEDKEELLKEINKE